MSDYVEVKGVKVRVGDRVRWVSEGVVKEIDHGDLICPIRIDDGTRRRWPCIPYIQSLEVLPPAIKVGDFVEVLGMKGPCEVLAEIPLNGNDFVCLAGGYMPVVVSASLCTKVTPA